MLENTAGGTPIGDPDGPSRLTRSGGAQGVSFSPVTLTAGVTYFVGFENVLSLGLNIVDLFQREWPGEQQPPGTVNLDGWWQRHATRQQFHDLHSKMVDEGADLQVFSAPILNFSGTPITPPPTPVPEASTWAMMFVGFAGLGFLGYRQTAKARAAA